MNVLVSSSPAPRAHPPRSNPFLRSSDAPPFPCITPSRVTWVMVVSFMIAVPSPWCRPLAGGLTPATNTTAPIRHRLPDFFEELSGTPVVSDPTARRLRGDGATSSSAPSADELLDQIDREDPDQW